MTQDEALGMLAGLAAKYGPLEACARVAEVTKIKSTTVYGWWRRASIPEWRLPAFDLLAKHLPKRRAK